MDSDNIFTAYGTVRFSVESSIVAENRDTAADVAEQACLDEIKDQIGEDIFETLSNNGINIDVTITDISKDNSGRKRAIPK